MLTLPHRNSYLVSDDQRLIAGEYPGAPRDREDQTARQRIAAHLAVGIDTFIDLTQVDELDPYAHLLPDGVRHLRLPIHDMSIPHATDHMRLILDSIDTALQSGRTVYLHCWGGIGRTGTAVGCWFVRHGRSGDAALAEVLNRYRTVEKYPRRPFSPETPAQVAYVRNWREDR